MSFYGQLSNIYNEIKRSQSYPPKDTKVAHKRGQSCPPKEAKLPIFFFLALCWPIICILAFVVLFKTQAQPL
jgi:hypothetical protein